MAVSRDAISKFATQAQLETYFTEVIGMITVKSYKAKGDGTTYDTQAVLDALADVKDNDLKSLYFPHGVYKVDPALIGVEDFAGIFCWGDNSTFDGIDQTINQIGVNLSVGTILNQRDSSIVLKIWEGTAAQYAAVAVKEADTLYFVTG